MASLQSITVEYVVSGSLDGVTPAPPIVIDESADDRTAFDPATQIYRVEVENLGIIDPDLGVGGSIGPRCIPFLWVDSDVLGDPGASLEVVGVQGDAVKLQEPVADLAGKAGAYLSQGFMVPQGSAVRVGGFTAGAEPIVVRVSILVPASCSDFALSAIAKDLAGGLAPVAGCSPGPIAFVYRPGGVAAGNVYTDFALLVACLATQEGPKLVEIDDEGGPPVVIPAGSFDLNGSTLVGTTPGGATAPGQTFAICEDGCVLDGLLELTGNLLLAGKSSSPVITLREAQRLRISGSAQILSLDPGFPTLEVVGGKSIIEVDGADAAIRGPGTVLVTSATLRAIFLDGAELDADTISGAGVGPTAEIVMEQDGTRAPGLTSGPRVSRVQTGAPAGMMVYIYMDAQEAPFVSGDPTPLHGYHVMSGPVTIPLATDSAGPIVLANPTGLALLVTASGADMITSNTGSVAPTLSVGVGASVTLKSNGAGAWQAFT